MIPFAPGFRTHALDGALLFFDRETGRSARWQGAETRLVTRSAPRVVMFGITNRCNLSCGFCSRDVHQGSAWTATTAFEVLADLATAGTLEVAFGGGEPLAFKGFVELAERLYDETELAVHLTTNGTLVDREKARRLARCTGEIRLSIYDGWQAHAARLADAGARWGANLLVTPDRVATLDHLLTELAAHGCRDVASLSYVGSDRGMHLDPAQDRALSPILRGAPLPMRVSVCFGDRLDVPRLFESGCEAGLDFVVVTSDKQLRACSFHDAAVDIETADDVLRIYRSRIALFGEPASRRGCARPHPTREAHDGLFLYEGFSGNNSGDCVLVGRFEKVGDARSFVEELLPGYPPGGHDFSEAWRTLLAGQGIVVGKEECAPDAIATVGRVVMLHTDSAADDDFPSLRTLLWKRGGRAVYNGIHEHDAVMLLGAVGFTKPGDVAAAEGLLLRDDVFATERRGLTLYVATTFNASSIGRSLGYRLGLLTDIATARSGVVGAELVPVHGELELGHALSAPGPKPGTPERLFMAFREADSAKAFAGELEGHVHVADRYVLLEATSIRARVGFRAQQRNGVAQLLAGPRTVLAFMWWNRAGETGTAIDPGEATASLRAALGPDPAIEVGEGHVVGGTVETTQPGPALEAIVALGARSGFSTWLEARDRHHVANAIARLDGDLTMIRRKR